MTTQHVLFCHCAYRGLIAPAARQQLLGRIRAAGIPVTEVPDLCDLAARRDPLLQAAMAHDHVTVAACRPRAVHWLLNAGGVDVCAEAVTFVDLRNADAEPPALNLTAAPPPQPVTLPQPPPPAWKPWFPVIDYDRCKACRQCLDFCLFGVYEAAADGRVTVANPANCKDNCPACARICPEAAIMFPKHEEAAINGGETAGAGVSSPLRIDVAALADGDLYEKLAARRRRAGGRRLFEPGGTAQAEAERAACACDCDCGCQPDGGEDEAGGGERSCSSCCCN
jgi:NAD-dependent dihydropyrimidine dehydrogenase PreA subunit